MTNLRDTMIMLELTNALMRMRSAAMITPTASVSPG